MWIEKTKTGLRAVERFKVNGKWKRFSVPIAKDTAQARRMAQNALLEKSKAIYTPAEATTLKQAIEEYLTLKDCRESTRIYLQNVFKSFFKMISPDICLTEITPLYIRKAIAASDISPTVINRGIVAFKTFARWAVDMEYLTDDIGSKIRLLKVEEKEKEPSELYLEADRLQQILDSMSGMYHYLARFLVLTGCRIGEAVALTPGDIDDRYVHITKSYSSTSHEISKPKNKSSIRDIFIQPELREMLREYMEWRRINMMAYGIRPKWLFYTTNGTIIGERNFRDYLNKHFSIHPHIFRHTHVALLAEQGIQLEVISRRLGHAGTAITKKVYYHVTEKQKTKDELALSSVRLL